MFRTFLILMDSKIVLLFKIYCNFAGLGAFCLVVVFYLEWSINKTILSGFWCHNLHNMYGPKHWTNYSGESFRKMNLKGSCDLWANKRPWNKFHWEGTNRRTYRLSDWIGLEANSVKIPHTGDTESLDWCR